MTDARGAAAGISRSAHARLRPVALSEVRVEGGFWASRLERLRTVTLPTQHRLLEETGRIDNFRRASGRRAVEFRGHYFNDSDVYKWMEAASHALAGAPDAALSRTLDAVIDDVAAAQGPDGYLNTYFTFDREPERYSDLANKHELYCAGHLIQAAVAHHRATGRRSLLDVALRLADHICATFGPDGRPGTGGHEEIELALAELYRHTGDRIYLDRAAFFLDQRGATPPVIGGSTYHQDHRPVREQDEAVGHAVRLTYLACGMADVAMETGDEGLAAASRALWESAFGRKGYVTGALGARYDGEAFGDDYELPNEGAYAETCAAVGGAMWCRRLLLMSGEARYADRLEIALYNAVLAGISLDGDAYFYANPLACRAPSAVTGSAEGGVLEAEDPRPGSPARRRRWFSCACCPPNVARLLASMPGYAYGTSGEGLWVHLFLAGRVATRLPDGSAVALVVETGYPWDGAVRLTVEESPAAPWTLRVRVPAWAEGASLRVNGQPAGHVATGAYAAVERPWRAGDIVEVDLPMPVRRIMSHARVTANAGRVALARGPLVYCLEGHDHDVADLDDIAIPAEMRWTAEHRRDLLSGVTVLRGDAVALAPAAGTPRHRPADGRGRAVARSLPVTVIPYFAWANRGPASMQVWTRTYPA